MQSPLRGDTSEAQDPLLAAAQQEINNSRALRAQANVASSANRSALAGALSPGTARRNASPPQSTVATLMTSPIRTGGGGSPSLRSPPGGRHSSVERSFGVAASGITTSTGAVPVARRADYFPSSSHEASILEETITHAQQLQQRVQHLEQLLVAEERSAGDLRTQLAHEVRMGAGSRARVDELTQLLDKSNLLCEDNASKHRAARSQLELVLAELQSSIADMTKLTAANGELNTRLEETLRELDESKKDLSAVTTERDELQQQLSAARRERDENRRTIDELRNDVQSLGKKHEAAAQLANARATGLQAEMRHQMDTMTTQIAELQGNLSRTDADLQLLRTESSATIKRLEDHLGNAETIIANLRRELQHERDVNTQRVANYQQRETEQGAELSDLRRRIEEVHRQRDGLAKELADRCSQIEHLNDVNHVLAVRLKGAGAEKEAHDMEVEARRVLTKQNADMEKQLVELRRTIQLLMASRGSGGGSGW
jgi:chromosome segregation ATPase